MKQASLRLLRMFIAAALVICLCFTVAIAAVGSAEQNSPEPTAPAAVSASEAADDAVDAAPSECLPDENADPVLFSWERSTKAMLLLENGPLKMRGYKTVEGHHASYTCPIYPDFYGGAYFEPDKDTLYVYLTDISMRSKLEKTLGEYKDCVIFLEAELNLNELLSLAQNTACLLSAAGYEVLTYGTDEINHKAAIDVFHEDYEAAKAYLEISGIEHLDFITLDCMYGKPILLPGEVHESARLPYEFDDIERE